MDLVAGAQIAGKYRLDRKIGSGGMGEVWAATQIPTRKPVALKFLRGAEAGEPETRRRFLREARAACAVRHPNVVEVHDVIEIDDGAPVMVMELLRGESLEARMRREGRLAVGDLAGIVARVVSAVGTAHALGIVHRDLKPDNIFLAETPEGVDVKVLDFGIAKLTALDGDAAQTGGLTNTGAMLGTPFYMSPEQAFGEKRIDHRADIWSLGIIIYRGISGLLPTRADNIGQILKIIMTHAIAPLGDAAPHAPRELVELVDRMLQQSPADRPADLREVSAVLARHAGVAVDAFDAPVAPPPSEVTAANVNGDTARGMVRSRGETQLKKRAPVTTALVAAATLAVLAVIGLSIRRVQSAAPPVTTPAAAPEVAAPMPMPMTATATAEPELVASAEPVEGAGSAAPSASAIVKAPPPPGASARVQPGRARASAAPAESAAPRSNSLGGVVTNPNF